MSTTISIFFFFFFNDTATTEIYTLSLHDALPISLAVMPLSAHASFFGDVGKRSVTIIVVKRRARSEEHTSELQSQSNLVCRLLLEKKKKKKECHICARHVPCTYTISHYTYRNT